MEQVPACLQKYHAGPLFLDTLEDDLVRRRSGCLEAVVVLQRRRQRQGAAGAEIDARDTHLLQHGVQSGLDRPRLTVAHHHDARWPVRVADATGSERPGHLSRGPAVFEIGSLETFEARLVQLGCFRQRSLGDGRETEPQAREQNRSRSGTAENRAPGESAPVPERALHESPAEPGEHDRGNGEHCQHGASGLWSEAQARQREQRLVPQVCAVAQQAEKDDRAMREQARDGPTGTGECDHERSATRGDQTGEAGNTARGVEGEHCYHDRSETDRREPLGGPIADARWQIGAKHDQYPQHELPDARRRQKENSIRGGRSADSAAARLTAKMTRTMPGSQARRAPRHAISSSGNRR